MKTTIREQVAEAHGCKHYEQGQYEACLQDEIESIFNKTIKCIPPWFTKEYKQVSNDLSRKSGIRYVKACSSFSVALLISHKRLNIKFKIYSSIFMQIFTHSSQKLVCHPVKSWSIKPFIGAMMPNQANNIYLHAIC